MIKNAMPPIIFLRIEFSFGMPRNPRKEFSPAASRTAHAKLPLNIYHDLEQRASASRLPRGLHPVRRLLGEIGFLRGRDEGWNF
jgi:hypothetical protein